MNPSTPPTVNNEPITRVVGQEPFVLPDGQQVMMDIYEPVRVNEIQSLTFHALTSDDGLYLDTSTTLEQREITELGAVGGAPAEEANQPASEAEVMDKYKKAMCKLFPVITDCFGINLMTFNESSSKLKLLITTGQLLEVLQALQQLGGLDNGFYKAHDMLMDIKLFGMPVCVLLTMVEDLYKIINECDQCEYFNEIYEFNLLLVSINALYFKTANTYFIL